MLAKLKKIFQVILGLGIGALCFYFIIGYAGLSDIFQKFAGMAIGWIGLFFFISICIDLTLALRWWVILKYHGHYVPYPIMLAYRMMGYAVSYITPSARVGGEAVRALMLKRHGISSADAFSSVILDKALELTAYIFFGAIGAVMVLLTFKVPKLTYVLMVVAFALTVYLEYKFFSKLKSPDKLFLGIGKKWRLLKYNWGKKLFAKLDEIEESMSAFLNYSMKGFLIAILMSGFLWLLMFAEYWVIMQMLGHPTSLVHIFLIGVFLGISLMIPVPAALGVMEGGQGSLFKMLGKEASLGVAFSLMIRARDLVRLFVGFWFLSHYGVSFLGKKKNNGTSRDKT